MRAQEMLVGLGLVGLVSGLASSSALAAGGRRPPVMDREPAPLVAPPARPAAVALRFGEADLLARFSPEVRANAKLRERALALWQSHFAAAAEDVTRRFTRDDDWRPSLADAAGLIDDFLEASLLPRAGADDDMAPPGHVWIETLDPRTEQRTRVLRKADPRPTLFAPDDEDDKKLDRPKAPKVPQRRGPWEPSDLPTD